MIFGDRETPEIRFVCLIICKCLKLDDGIVVMCKWLVCTDIFDKSTAAVDKTMTNYFGNSFAVLLEFDQTDQIG